MVIIGFLVVVCVIFNNYFNSVFVVCWCSFLLVSRWFFAGIFVVAGWCLGGMYIYFD